jgi:hypothetical protein
MRPNLNSKYQEQIKKTIEPDTYRKGISLTRTSTPIIAKNNSFITLCSKSRTNSKKSKLSVPKR